MKNHRFILYLLILFFFPLYTYSQTNRFKICVAANSYNKMFGTSMRANVMRRAHAIAINEDIGFKNKLILSSSNDTEFVTRIQSFIHEGCKVIIGLYTSKECLLAGPYLQKNKVLGVSPTCSHDDIRKYSPYILTGVPSISRYSEKISEFVKREDYKNVMVFYQPSELFSKIGFEEFQKRYSKKFDFVEIDASGIIKDGGKAENIINSFESAAKSVLIFFSYPMPSAQAVLKLNLRHEKMKEMDVIGSSSWVFDRSAFNGMTRDKIKIFNHVFIPDVIDQDITKSSPFRKKYLGLFHEEPLGIHYLAYDITNSVFGCSKQIEEENKNNKYNNISNTDNFMKCYTKKTFKGSSGIFTFSNKDLFSKRKIKLTDFKGKL